MLQNAKIAQDLPRIAADINAIAPRRSTISKDTGPIRRFDPSALLISNTIVRSDLGPSPPPIEKVQNPSLTLFLFPTGLVGVR
jgi:hypothetical protein